MNEQQKNKLRELLLNAIDAYQKLEEAKKNLEQSRAAFGWAKLYDNEPRLINIDGQIWSVTVPFPNSDYEEDTGRGIIVFENLGKAL